MDSYELNTKYANRLSLKYSKNYVGFSLWFLNLLGLLVTTTNCSTEWNVEDSLWKKGIAQQDKATQRSCEQPKKVRHLLLSFQTEKTLKTILNFLKQLIKLSYPSLLITLTAVGGNTTIFIKIT